MTHTVDVARVIDEGPFSGYQKLLIGGTALMVVLDGVDNQLLPNALPSMMGEWSLPRAAFANASAAAPFGMIVGGVLGGMLGDRLGRRATLLGSVLWFAVLSLPGQDAVLFLLFGLLRTGQVKLRKMDGWQEMVTMKRVAEAA